MKLTHCQIGKLFLLLTAFFLLLDSQQLVGVLCSAENVAIERLNALDADTTGEQTTVTAIRQAQATAITNVTAVSAVQIVDKVCGRNKNNNNSKKSSNNSKKLLETCVEVESQPQENAEIFAIEVPRKTFEYTTTTTEATTAKGYNVLHAPSIAHPIDAELMSTVEATETQQFRAEVTNAQEQQNVAQLQHKLITTRTNTTRSATLTAGTTNVATTKLESFGKLSGAQNVASIKAATERQMAHNVQQQQVPSQKQQQQRKAQMHRPQEQFDTMRQPLATITTNSTTKLATTQVSAHIATEMKKLQKFETEMSQQQLPKQQQQQRLKSTNKENKAKRPIQKHVNPEIRKQRKQKPLEFVLGQQQQQQHAAQQQLLTSKPRATRNRQPQQSATEWRRQQQVYEQLQQDAQHVPAAHESLRQQQHTAERRQHVGVLIPSRILDVLHVQQGFYNFLDFFHVNLQNVSVDFIHDDDISGFIKLLEHPKYTTVVKTLNTGINLSDDELPLNGKSTSATVAATLPSQRQSHQQQRRLQQQSVVTPAQINNATAAFMKVGEMKKSSSSSNAPLVAYCHLAEQLSRDFNKTVLVWPCPRMKESSNFLPSFEAISYAVKSIATKLNWTHVDIYVGDENWGMPLAIAANLHVPYKIEIADDIRDLQAQDKIGKAIIITADMNDASTLQLLTQLVGLQHTKVLLIDVVATSFNAENNFYKNLARINGSAELMSNLLLLTVLSDKYRYFLKVAFEDNGIGLVQNFRQMRRWKAMTNDGKRGPETGMLNWPMHLDSSVTRALQEHEEAMAAEAFVGDNEKPATTTTSTTTVRPTRDTLAAFDECPQLSGLNFVEICPNIENVTARCVQFLQQNHKDNKNTTRNGKVLQQLRTLLKQLCHIHPVAGHSRAEQARIANLRNFIDFFHFYDFIITSIRQQLAALATKPNPTKKKQVNVSTTKLTENRNGNAGDIDTPAGVISAQMPKYDFIVLDVVHENATANNNNHNNNNKSSVATNAAMLDFNSGVKTDTINSAADTESTASMDSIKWRPLLILEQHEINSNTYITHSLQPGYDEWLLVSTAQLWQCGAICWTIVAICIGLLLIIVAASVAAGIAMRNYFLRKRLSKGPNKIVLSADDFVFPVDSRRNLLPPTRTAKELLWTAPELLRSMKTNHHHHGRVLGTQMGDVYSFGIIMQEVVVRGEPYCMLSLSPDEIIAKIKKPPPLIRPSVSKGAAPPEAINIMRQCWAEQPDMRPDFNSVYERFKMLNHGRKVNFVDTMFQMLEKYSNNLEELIRERTDQLDIERKKTEQLLNRMLPSSVAEKLKMGLAVEPEEFSDVTIYFSDIVGFTTIAAHCSPVQVVDLLNDLYTIFDATINAYNVYKVETIGDAYMVVSGLPVKIPDHAEQIATMALDLLHQSGRFNVKHLPGVPLQLRIGLHTGPCCAGVVGLTMPRYCLFGDTVNTASRMESTGSSWRIHMSQETRDRLEARGGYTIEQRGLIEIKGKGMMNTFWLLGKKGFDKPLPAPPPIGESHGLDESLIRNSITLKAQANKSRNSTNPSSSQSSSLAGESVEVKVEITPPTNADICSSNLPNSYSLDSTSTNTISPNVTLCPDFPAKTPNASPQSRKMSELSPENLLTPGTFNRLPSSAGGSSSRLYKKIEEMMDLSSPYNHYKCLSPSESNLTQFYDGKYLYSGGGVCSAVGGGTGSGGGSVHSSSVKFDSKPGSSRLLRRQFSLDRDDTQSKSEHHHHHQHHQSSLQGSFGMTLTNKSSMLDIPILHETSRSPKGTLARAHKQNSTSITQDLEKIEEIPLSPASSQHHSSLDSNLNRSPPSTVEAQTPPATLAAALLSAPTSPAPSRTLNGVGYNMGVGSGAVTESPTTDASTATTTASANSNNTTPGEESGLRRNELTLNVETLLSR
ncbi:uncharacterized protein LOC105218644 isoform X3 [Zeugodacus cucurbitae]|uniref:uncharacterized protein LOC105218644 isoform X3 n=1 Tax=Zeugodacus cucurbitae TaxID=28588 RepID=UPI0023D8EF01|nr:uncharacterized protein LOC105218644 isoform X3 [Zeugodacus cucurbitae]